MEKAVLKLTDGYFYIGDLLNLNEKGDITIKFIERIPDKTPTLNESMHDLIVGKQDSKYTTYKGEITLYRENILFWYKK